MDKRNTDLKNKEQQKASMALDEDTLDRISGGITDSKEPDMLLKIGDNVLISKYSGTEIVINGERFTVLGQTDGKQ